MRLFNILIALLLAIFMVFSLGVEGCEGDKEEDTGAKAFLGGSEGLSINFVKDEPPNKVLDNNQDPFYITLMLENKGEYTIDKDKVIASLSGISQDAFSMSSLTTKNTIDIGGKQKDIEGEKEELGFPQANYKYDLTADFITSVRADVCYLYASRAISSLCLKKDAVKRDEDDTCEIRNENVEIESSGAPLKISNMRERTAGSNEIKFIFDITKLGDGDVYEPDTFSASCSGQDEKKDKVKVETDSPANLDISCSTLDNKATGTVRLIDGKKTISCTVKTSNLQETAFETPVNIEVTYFYRDSISKDLTVENSGY